MSFVARFELSFFDEEVDIDLTQCEKCPHRHGNCWKANRCLMEEH